MTVKAWMAAGGRILPETLELPAGTRIVPPARPQLPPDTVPHDQRPRADGLSVDTNERDQAHARVTPPGGRRWRQLAELDERVDALDKRAGALSDERLALEEQHTHALRADKEKLAGWVADPQGERPEPTAPLFERRLAETEANRQALELAVARVLQEKTRFVERHRGRLLREARKEKTRAVAELQRKLTLAEQAREQAVELLGLEQWTIAFPSQEASSDLGTGFARGGRIVKAIPEARGARLTIGQLHEALRQDASWLHTALDEQSEDNEPDVREEAVWEQSAEGRKAVAAENQRVAEGLAPKNLNEAGWD